MPLNSDRWLRLHNLLIKVWSRLIRDPSSACDASVVCVHNVCYMRLKSKFGSAIFSCLFHGILCQPSGHSFSQYKKRNSQNEMKLNLSKSYANSRYGRDIAVIRQVVLPSKRSVMHVYRVIPIPPNLMVPQLQVHSWWIFVTPGLGILRFEGTRVDSSKPWYPQYPQFHIPNRQKSSPLNMWTTGHLGVDSLHWPHLWLDWGDSPWNPTIQLGHYECHAGLKSIPCWVKFVLTPQSR